MKYVERTRQSWNWVMAQWPEVESSELDVMCSGTLRQSLHTWVTTLETSAGFCIWTLLTPNSVQLDLEVLAKLASPEFRRCVKYPNVKEMPNPSFEGSWTKQGHAQCLRHLGKP